MHQSMKPVTAVEVPNALVADQAFGADSMHLAKQCGKARFNTIVEATVGLVLLTAISARIKSPNRPIFHPLSCTSTSRQWVLCFPSGRIDDLTWLQFLTGHPGFSASGHPYAAAPGATHQSPSWRAASFQRKEIRIFIDQPAGTPRNDRSAWTPVGYSLETTTKDLQVDHHKAQFRQARWPLLDKFMYSIGILEGKFSL